MTFPFSLQIKDYNTFAPLSNKQIQITNIDSKQTYTQTTDSRGYVSFTIKESERGDFFKAELVNDDDYEQNPYFLAKEILPNPQKQQTIKHTIQKLLTPNNYQNHPAVLYFKAQISLYFNGTTLCIMQGTRNLASFNARSGKALNIKEKEQLQQERGYKYFVVHTNKGLFSDETMYFCLDKDWQKQKDKGVIPEGEYYIKSNEINKRTTYIQENTFSINTRIYTDKECTNVVESNTNRDNFYLYNFYNQSENKCSNDNGIDIVNNESDCFNILKCKTETQEVIKLQVTYPKKLESKIDFIYMSDDGLQRDKEYLHTDTIFAPGTYIELIAPHLKGESSIQWGYSVQYSISTKEGKIISKNKAYQPFIPTQTNTQFLRNRSFSHKIGCYLPLQRDDENDFIDYKILIYAHNNTQTTTPNQSDAYIAIDMSFKVGKDSHNGVIESKREKQKQTQQQNYQAFDQAISAIQAKMPNNGELAQTTKESLPHWNALNSICTLEEAVMFLRANKAKLNELYQNNQARYNQKDSDENPIYDVWFDYYRIHPSLAGKIAYIYYRFDVGDEGFVESVGQSCYILSDCKDEYKAERKEFIETITQVYTGISLSNSLVNPNTRNYKQEFEDRFLHNKNIQAQQLIQDFINDMGRALNIKQEFIPQVYDDQSSDNAGTYNGNANTLSVKLLESYTQNEFIDLMDTIIHEFRHFYMYYVFENAGNHRLKQSYLAQLVYGNAYMYVSWEYETLFNAYDKECASFDAEIKQCAIRQTYLQHSQTSSPLYYIQPSERDCRVVAGAFRKQVGL